MSDIDLLNESVAAEYFGVAAYEAAINSGLLDDGVADVARAFQHDHVVHAEAFAEEVRARGGEAVEAKAMEVYASDFPPLGSQADVLNYAIELESGAAKAEMINVGRYQDPKLAVLAAQIGGVEAMHWAALLQATGQNPVPHAILPAPVAA